MAPEFFPMIVVGVIMIIAAAANRWAEAARQRSREMAALASELGFEFHPDGLNPKLGFFDMLTAPGPSADTVFVSQYHGLSPFGQGHSHLIADLLVGALDGVSRHLFDYSFKTGSGKETTLHHYGVVVAEVSFFFPALTLTPETILHRIGSKVGLRSCISSWKHSTAVTSCVATTQRPRTISCIRGRSSF